MPLLLLFTSLYLTGCVSWYKGNTATAEELLAAAGFHPYYPQDAREETNLKTIPQQQLLRVHGAVKPTYLWADDDECDCIFVGGETQYNQLKQLTLSKHQADEALRAAEYRENWVLDSGGYQGVMGGYW
jgi:hypothetical protein